MPKENEYMDKQQDFFNRITRDISDGLIFIDNHGVVQYLNPSAEKLLGSTSLKEGVKVTSFILEDIRHSNDDFLQYILDSIYAKETTHSGEVQYILTDGSTRWFRLQTSYAHDDDGSNKTGVIIQFSDITAQRKAKQKYSDAIMILISMIAVMAIWNYLYAVWEQLGRPLPSSALSYIIEMIGLVGTLLALRYTSITMTDFGLGFHNIRKAIRFNLILTVCIMTLMILAKLCIQRFFPNIISPEEPLFNWGAVSRATYLYPLSVVLQEFLTRGAAQGCLERVLPDDSPASISIIVSSLFFGALHVHKGLALMLGAAALLSFFGILYKKQGTIWGLCIPHFFLGLTLTILWL